MPKNITTMIGFGFWDGSNNGFAGVNDNVLNLLDFPMESLEGDGLGEDLDTKFQRLGPIPWEALQRLSTTPTLDVRNGTLDMQSNSSVPSEQTCQLNQKPEFVEEASRINNLLNSSNRKESAPHEPHSPISALSSSGSSCSAEKSAPISMNTLKNIPCTRKSNRKKKKLSQLFGVKQRPSKQPVPTKKCTHCEIGRTPQWREGPMGPKTLCNACGVRYRSGRLLPEYRPAASPTFVPSLHSNLHQKVIEIRNGTVETSTADNELALSPKAEKV